MNYPAVLDYPGGILEFVDSNAVSPEADRVKSLFHETRNSLWSSLSLGYSREECQSKLLDAWRATVTPDWDGYGAHAAQRGAVANAYAFIDALPSNVSMPEVFVDPDGEISFDWFSAPRRQFSVSIGTDNVLSYAGLFSSDKVTGRERFQGTVPRALLDHIKRVE